MPQSQALHFAIRTRRAPQPTHATCRLPALLSARNASMLCKQHNSVLRTLQSTGLKPSFLRLAIFRRHLTALHSSSRPQATFLSHNLYKDRSFKAALGRFIRQQYMTQAKKQRWRETLRWQIRFHSYAWPMIALLYLMYTGYRQMEREHENPTPSEWSFWARWDGRTAKFLLKQFEKRGWLSNYHWGCCGEYLEKLLARLEDPKRDGKGIREQEVKDGQGTLMVDGVGKLGYDISRMSEKWKQGYWEALMGTAKVAEHMDGLCKRKGEKLSGQIYKWENIPGPENPRPVPPAWDKNGAHLSVPQIQEVEPAMADPETYYLRVLTTKGFSNRQRLDTALAYADWCDFKGLRDTAAHVFDWAIDIAAGGLPEGSNHVVDIQTGIINPGKESQVTENLLKASTALGVWHARHGEVKEALPIFLSVLRARKALPPAPPEVLGGYALKMSQKGPANQTATDVLTGYVNGLMNFFTEQDHTLVKSSGDERLFHSLKDVCEEVGLMTYIGEILFATSAREREKGLSWTRDSVDAAEAVLWFMDEQQGQDAESRARCKECLETGLANWQQMAKQMGDLAKQKEEATKKSNGWFGLGIGKDSSLKEAATEVRRWADEEAEIELRRQKTASLLSPLGRSTG